MKQFIPSLLLLFATYFCYSQVSETYVVMPGQKISEAIPKKVLYSNANFVQGTVLFRNGNYATSKLNHNRLKDEVEFINETGDTLSLNDEKNIDYITIAKDTLYYFDGFITIKDNAKDVKFGYKKLLALSNRQKVGGMGELSAASIGTPDRLSSSQGIMDITASARLTFKEYTTYFIGDEYNKFKQLSKKSLTDMYNKNLAPVQKYLQDNHVNFLKEEDVNGLIKFLKTVQ